MVTVLAESRVIMTVGTLLHLGALVGSFLSTCSTCFVAGEISILVFMVAVEFVAILALLDKYFVLYIQQLKVDLDLSIVNSLKHVCADTED